MDPVAEFFAAPPLNEREARRLAGQREAKRRNDAHDETGTMSEDEERRRADWSK